MTLTTKQYQQYLNTLNTELIPAMGCTEPIAIAYLASYAKALLKEDVLEVSLKVSGNILKNVKSVIVPNTDKLKGIKSACAAGIVCGDASKELEVLSNVSEKKKKEIINFIDNTKIDISLSESVHIFDLLITLKGEKHKVQARIINNHTNIVFAQRDDEVIISNECEQTQDHKNTPPCLCINTIVEFADTVEIKDIEELFDRQISYNMAIAQEGMDNDYGANIGKILYNTYGHDVKTKAKAMAAAASDARMNGCELPVVIVSGSGNQGITASVPVIVYAQEEHYTKEELYRALVISNLVTIHQKSGIGRLSAFCGVVSAGIGSGAGIAYLKTKNLNAVSHTIVNGLGVVSGMICDGAKASCAAKIQSAVDAGLLGFYMYQNNQEFKDGDGLTLKGVENTINNISRLAKVGMRETDKEIISMMIKEC